MRVTAHTYDVAGLLSHTHTHAHTASSQASLQSVLPSRARASHACLFASAHSQLLSARCAMQASVCVCVSLSISSVCACFTSTWRASVTSPASAAPACRARAHTRMTCACADHLWVATLLRRASRAAPTILSTSLPSLTKRNVGIALPPPPDSHALYPPTHHTTPTVKQHTPSLSLARARTHSHLPSRARTDAINSTQLHADQPSPRCGNAQAGEAGKGVGGARKGLGKGCGKTGVGADGGRWERQRGERLGGGGGDSMPLEAATS